MSRIRRGALENGIPVITEEMADVESATVGVWVKTGSRSEVERLGGISHLIEHMLFKGTPTRSAHDIAAEIESVGGVLNAFTGREYTCFYAKVLAKDIERAIDLLADIFLNSLFDAEELAREKQVICQEIKMVDDTPDDLIHDLFSEAIWEGHPLGRPILGTAETLGPLARKDIRQYMSRHYRPGSVFITAAGRFTNKAIVKNLERAFAPLKPGPAPKKLRRPKAKSQVKLHRRKLEQVHLCLGVPAPAQASPERYKLYLLSTILGGGMSSRLFQEIREKRGLAYSIYSYLNLSIDSGAFTIYAGTSSESFSEVLNVLLGELGAIAENVTPLELQNAKDQLKGSMILGLESSDNRMMKMAKDEIYYARTVPIKELVRGIDRVKVSDITGLAEELFDPKKLTLAAIGSVKRSALPRVLKEV